MPLSRELLRIRAIQDEATRERELLRQIRAEETDFLREGITRRLSDPVWEGTEEEARAETQADFDVYLQPLTTEWGTFGDTSGSIIPTAPAMDLPPPPGFTPGIGTAMSRQTTVGPVLDQIVEEEINIDSEQDWDAMALEATNRGGPQDEVDLEINALKEGFREYTRIHGGTVVNPETRYENFIAEIDDIDAVLAGERGMIEDPSSLGLNDQLYRAFSKQFTPGEPVPDLSPGQMAYLTVHYDAEEVSAEADIIRERNDTIRANRERARQSVGERIVTIPGRNGRTYPYDMDTTHMSHEERLAFRQAKRNPRNVSTRQVPAAVDEVLLSENTVRNQARERAGRPWFTNAETRAEVLANPKRIVGEGLFSRGTAFGGNRETNIGHGLRSAIMPMNVVASGILGLTDITTSNAAQLLAIALEDNVTLDDFDWLAPYKLRARSQDPLYRGSPTLGNVAGNLGLTGQAVQIADELNLEGLTKGIYVGGSFGADLLLDPTMGLISGVSKGARTAVQVTRLRGAGAGLRAGRDAAWREFLSDPSLISGGIKMTRLNPNLDSIGDVRGLIARDITDKIVEQRAAGSLGVDVGKLADEGTAGIVADSNRRIEGLRDIMSGKPTITITDHELGSVIGYVVRNNPEAEALVRGVDIFDDSSNTSRLHNWTRALSEDEDIVKELHKRLTYEASLDGVMKATKDQATGFDDVVALTDRTWTTEEQAGVILSKVSKTDAGRLGIELAADGTKEIRHGIAGYDLDISQADDLIEEISHLLTTKNITKQLSDDLIEEISEGTISVEGLNRIIDGVIDQTASSIYNSRTTKLLGTSQRKAILEPMETRSYGREVFNTWKNKNNKLPGDIEGIVDTQHKRLIDQMRSRSNKLDKKLLNDRKDILKNPSRYGLGPNPTEHEVISALIVGENKNVEQLSDVLNWMIDHALTAEKTVETILSRSIGITNEIRNKILSPAGQDLLDAAIKRTIERSGRGDIFDSYGEVYIELKDIIKNLDNLKPGINPDHIKMTDEIAITTELQTGAYYNAETRRLVDSTFEDIIKTDPSLPTLRASSTITLPNGVTDGMMTTQLTVSVGMKIDSGEVLNMNQLQKLFPDIDEIDLQRLGNWLNDTAETVVRNNPILSAQFKHGSVSRMGEMIFSNDGALIFGETIYKEIKALAESGMMNDFNKLVNQSLRDFDYKSIDSFYKLRNAISDARYTLILGVRPRFHIANIISGPTITYATTGRTGFRGMREATGILWNGRFKSNPKYYKPAFTDGAGRTYTYGQLYDSIVLGGGSRSALGFNINIARVDDIAKRLKRKKYDPRIIGDIAKEAAETEDMFFRLSVAVEAMKKGRSLDDAVRLSREAMFDYNDMTSGEKALSRNWFMFYAFTRQNVTHLVRSMADPAKIRRYLNILKFKRGTQMLLAEINDYELPDEMMTPSYTMARILLNKREGVYKDFGIYTPSIPAIDALASVIGLITDPLSQVQETFGGFIHPTWARGIGLEKFSKNYDTVRPEHVAAIALTGANHLEIADALSVIVGGVVIPTVCDIEKGGVNGYCYNLNADQEKRYKFVSQLFVEFIGADTFVTDVLRTINPETAYRGTEQPGDRFLQGAGFNTPIGLPRDSSTRGWSLKDRIEAARSRKRDLD